MYLLVNFLTSSEGLPMDRSSSSNDVTGVILGRIAEEALDKSDLLADLSLLFELWPTCLDLSRIPNKRS